LTNIAEEEADEINSRDNTLIKAAEDTESGAARGESSTDSAAQGGVASTHNHISFKKNKDQTRILDIEFDKNPIWSKQKMRELGDILGLKESQIYKWHWDRSQTVQKRFQKNLRKINRITKTKEEAVAKD